MNKQILKDPNGGTYEGEVKNGQPHGQGSLLFLNGDKYVGEFKNGTPEGQGTFFFKNGDKYTGGYKNGDMHGEGIIELSDGITKMICKDGQIIGKFNEN